MTGLCVAWVAAERAWFGVVGDAPNGGAWGSVLWTTDGADFAVLWGAVAYSAVGPGALANWLQTRGQAAVPAAEAQLIFATTPVFNAALSIAFLGESAGSNTLVGGAIILAASLLPAALGEDGARMTERMRTRSGESATRARVSIPSVSFRRDARRGSSLKPRHARDGTSVTEECPSTITIAFAIARRVLSFPRLVLVVGLVVLVVANVAFSSRRQKDVESSGERGSRVSYRRALRLRLFSRRAQRVRGNL